MCSQVRLVGELELGLGRGPGRPGRPGPGLGAARPG
jgi:hypothetical protein